MKPIGQVSEPIQHPDDQITYRIKNSVMKFVGKMNNGIRRVDTTVLNKKINNTPNGFCNAYNIQKRAHPISIQSQHPKKCGF